LTHFMTRPSDFFWPPKIEEAANSVDNSLSKTEK